MMMANLHTTSDDSYSTPNGSLATRPRSDRRPPSRALVAVNGRRPVGAGPVGRDVRPPSNPLLLVHALLRGRYPWAIAAATALAVAGGAVGFKSQKPLYTSTGAVSVDVRAQKLLYETDENGNMPAYVFADLVGKQASYLSSADVALSAMDEPEWKADGWGSGVQEMGAFREALSVTVPRGQSIVKVEFTALEPKVAFAGLRSTVNAFEKGAKQRRANAQNERKSGLEQRRKELAAKVKADRERKEEIANDYGAADLEPRYQVYVQLLTQTELRLQALEAAAVDRGIDLNGPNTNEQSAATSSTAETQWDEALGEGAAPTTAPVLVVTDDQMRLLAARNRGFAQQLAERDQARQQMAILKMQYGPNAPHMIMATNRLNQIEEATNSWAAFYAQDGMSVEETAAQYAGKSAAKLREQYKELTELAAIQKSQVIKLGNDARRIENLNRAMAFDEAQLAAFDQALMVLETEKDFGERIEVTNKGAIPAAPSTDKRIPFALAGAACGAFLGMGLVALRGLLDGRMRWLDDPRNADLLREDRVLAALPDMHGSGGLVAGEDEAVAFQLHKLRLSLQRAARADRRSFAITSPVAGDGKTSVTMALGLSLAASGTRTLLIDFDLVGKSLSRRFARKQTPGEVHVPDRGLGAILRGSSVSDCYRETDVKRLSLLGCADAGSEDARRLSPRFARHVLREALEHFEMVLIDTGPLLASLEANTIAAETDGAVLCVSRGTDRELVKRSVDLLGEKCRNFEGIVINRLDAQQFDKYVSSTMSMSVPNDPTASWRSVSAKQGGVPTLVTRTAPGAKSRLATDNSPQRNGDGTTGNN